jgi:chromosome segregation ATPase
MNQPVEQRITKIEQRLDNLERQERAYSFTVSDIAHKTTIALGMLTAQEADIKEMRTDIGAIKATQAEHGQLLREHGQLLREHGKRFNNIEQKLDLLLKLLQPRLE